MFCPAQSSRMSREIIYLFFSQLRVDKIKPIIKKIIQNEIKKKLAIFHINLDGQPYPEAYPHFVISSMIPPS